MLKGIYCLSLVLHFCQIHPRSYSPDSPIYTASPPLRLWTLNSGRTWPLLMPLAMPVLGALFTILAYRFVLSPRAGWDDDSVEFECGCLFVARAVVEFWKAGLWGWSRAIFRKWLWGWLGWGVACGLGWLSRQ